ncbi:NAD(P)-dependent oxidoreductase [Pseudonocardia pini]|uniref:NAD(P)-dependent oxidoreductase n=1 Tax=Pseudonocardia pini TaxID=2758030 RepID=UPI0015F009AE|nr:NAD(P)H-binding protein [Pseudonocardia pini]
MIVTVLGGTGRIGHHVVEQLLAAGHEVRVVARNPGKLALSDPDLAVHTGPLSDEDMLRGAVRGADAVVSALGPTLRPGVGGRPLTEGTARVVRLMGEEGVRRFVGLATPSLPDERDRPTLKARVLPVMAGTLFPNALADLRGMTEAVTSSDLDWTVARITRPTDGPPTGRTRSGFLGVDAVGSAMRRSDIAAFLVAQLTDHTYVGALPAISN